MKILLKIGLAAGFTCLSYFSYLKFTQDVDSDANDLLVDVNANYPCKNNGKDLCQIELPTVYTPSSLKNIDLPPLSNKDKAALQHQLKLIKIRKQRAHQVVGNLNLSVCELEETIEAILESPDPKTFHKKLDAYRVGGKKNTGEVLMTSYYTPLIDVSKRRTSYYKYPIYRKPKDYSGKLPTRKVIEEEGLNYDEDLILAYAHDKLDIYFMQLQGSGYVKYRDGSKEMFGYGGSNAHHYRSIGRYLKKREDISIDDISQDGLRAFFKKNPLMLDEVLNQNPSYTFFKPRNSLPKGAGHVPLTEGISIAVDRRYIPLGATLIAAVPKYNEEGSLYGHDLKMFLAQDVGGAIKSSGHIDIYMGVGDKAQKKASQFYHYGKMWLLLPKTYEGGEERLVMLD